MCLKKDLTCQGANLGGSKVSATTATLQGGFLHGGVQLTASNLDLQGDSGVNIVDDGSALIVGTAGVVSSKTVLNLAGGSSFQIAAGASLKHNAAFQISQGAPQAKSPAIVNNGAFACT